MSLVIRVLIGFALATGGLTFLVYGIAQAIEVGNCGTDELRELGRARRARPARDPMIVLMVLGTFVAIVGAGLASPGRGASGIVGGTLRFIAALIIVGGRWPG